MVLLTSLAFAGERALEMTFTRDGVALVEGTYVLPEQPEPIEIDIDGTPHLVTTELDSRHDTVRVSVRIDKLKGKKKKPVELTGLDLTLYEDYPGTLNREDDAAYELTAVWTDRKPRKTRLEVPPVPPEGPEPTEAPEAPAEPTEEPAE